MKVLLLTMTVIFALYGCSDDKSHETSRAISAQEADPEYEYIRVIGYGSNWEEADAKLLTLKAQLLGKRRFKSGAGLCQKNLRQLDADTVRMHISAANHVMRDEPKGEHGIPVEHAKFQCIAVKGVNKECEQLRSEIKEGIYRPGHFDRKLALIELFLDCRIKEEVGKPRVISLRTR